MRDRERPGPSENQAIEAMAQHFCSYLFVITARAQEVSVLAWKKSGLN